MNSLNDLDIRVQDIRNMANTGRITCIDQKIRRYPETSRSNLRSSGIMFYGDNPAVFGTINVPIFGMLKKGIGSLIGAVEDKVITARVQQRNEEREREAQLREAISIKPQSTPALTQQDADIPEEF